MKLRFCALACSTLTVLTFAGVASAQEAPDQAVDAGGLRDIVVTARRTAESLQRVPVAVTGFDEQSIANLQIRDFGDVAKSVPNLDSQRQFGSANAPQFYMRGVSTGSLKFEQDAGIGLYVDGVYLGRPAGTAFSLAEIERIEVMRGPQATLFGRNSTGGAINFITAAPKGEFSVRAEGTYGNYDRIKGRISVDLPSFGPLSVRVSYLHDENEGYVKNLTPGIVIDFAKPFGKTVSAKTFGAENTDAVSLAARLNLDALVLDYKFDYTDKVSTQLGAQLLYTPTPEAYATPGSVSVPASRTRLGALPLDLTSPSHLKVQGHSLTATWEASDIITLKSITAYRKFNENVGGNDIDGAALVDAAGNPYTPLGSVQTRKQHQWSQEAQFLVKTDNLDLVLGGFYFFEKGRDLNPVFLSASFPVGETLTPSATAPLSAGGFLSDYFLGNDSAVRNKSYAGYAHATYRLGEAVELAGGVRYTKDKRRETLYAAAFIAPPTTVYSASGDHWDFDATASYIFSPRFRTYARFATGYVSGGILNGIAFKPETVKSYELGVKGDFLANRLRVNANIFQADRKNLQVLNFTPANGSYLVPLDKARDRGFEFELTAIPTSGLTYSVTLGYLDETLSQALGPRQTQAPKFTGNMALQYDLPASGNGSYLSFRGDASFKDNRNSNPVPAAETNIITRLRSRVDLGARIALNDVPIANTKARISVWGQNLTNNKELEFARDLGGPVIGVFQVPRTYGLDIGFAF
ncbi:TonB-dependent receptor domain-containing protein [Sphingobium sp. WCS2017Hpa-17]|uniref:TonB-dependent receptor n=1 Tax=Sphingobium sp. WCS2017Hpa-17 TaxID=3073638 RepID=UPI00288A1157|nr:TonB-dependent receptor [Sphingobium sp. WCS2017Hpa-17]